MASRWKGMTQDGDRRTTTPRSWRGRRRVIAPRTADRSGRSSGELRAEQRRYQVRESRLAGMDSRSRIEAPSQANSQDTMGSVRGSSALWLCCVGSRFRRR